MLLMLLKCVLQMSNLYFSKSGSRATDTLYWQNIKINQSIRDLKKCFSDYTMHKNHLEGLLKHRTLSHTPRIEHLHFLSFQVMLMLPRQEQFFENHHFKLLVYMFIKEQCHIRTENPYGIY